MSETKRIPLRSEIPVEETWAMEDIFASDELWEHAYEDLKKELEKFSKFQGKLGESGDQLYQCLKYSDEVDEKLENIFVYARQKMDQDTTVTKYQDYAGKAQAIAVQLASASSFIVPELLSIEEETLQKYMSLENGISHFKRLVEVIYRQKEHTRSAEIENLLALSKEVSDAPSQIFSMFNNADIQFPEVLDEEGNKIKLTQGRYMQLLESSNREVRKAAFEAMLGTYSNFKNTLASTFQSNLKQAAFYAKARGYHSTRAYFLSDSNVPEKVYDNLIKTVHDYLPLLHRYTVLRKKLLKLDELHMYDLYTPMVSGVEKKVNFEDGKTMVKEGLKPLGNDYLKILQEGYDNRWIDVYENKGKRTGAYSWGAYGTHPYVLLNYQDTLDNVFTLAHEMGHGIHSYYSDQAQPYTYAGYKIFVAEVASTCNESLLIRDLLKKTTDGKEKSYLLNNFLEKFRGTLFRQTMFAEFEMLTHRKVEAGETLTADSLCELYYELNVKYFGKEIVVDKEISMEWARIPHFYTPFYVYQYATGFSAAIALSDRILRDGESAVVDYMKLLEGGGSKDPIDLLKLAGVDMSENTPIEQAMKLFEELLNELEQLFR